MDPLSQNSNWIWHPEWVDADEGSAGSFVHFRKQFHIQQTVNRPIRIQITADTRYKLYVNSKLVFAGPVKGDEHLWFYDEVDIRPYLQTGTNQISVRVLRFYHATLYAASFSRLPAAGLLVRITDGEKQSELNIQSDHTWEAARDCSTRLPTNLKEDDFLHIYEDVNKALETHLDWMPAKCLQFPTTHGLSPPWNLSPRLIPPPRYVPASFKAIHNIQSSKSQQTWEKLLLQSHRTNPLTEICLPAGTSHHLELEAESHMTALLYFRFQWPEQAGSILRVTYSECYEDTPDQIPYLRRKGNRCDTSKVLIGPEDNYSFGGVDSRAAASSLQYHENNMEEIFAPFHFRTFRFITLDIVAKDCDLVMTGIDITRTNYPLEPLAEFNVSGVEDTMMYPELWTTSIRTLSNCMHDCYEDCPFYEQFQYAMDTRSSILFSYCLSGEDRLARQAIIQLHNSYNPRLGLTASRAPSHQPQIIPHFSLFWICMITDHFDYFKDIDFVRNFLPEIDGVLQAFCKRIDPTYDLIRSLDSPSQWDFVDWTEKWRPMGIPPAAKRTGFSTFTNMLYAYVLKLASSLLVAIGRPALADEYNSRAVAVIKAIRSHCFDSQFFTDGLARMADPAQDYSEQIQVWGILCGAVTGSAAREILSQCFSSLHSTPRATTVPGNQAHKRFFTPASTAMSFYTLRSFSLAGGSLYNDCFHTFWQPWRSQLLQNLTTWVEDSVSLRSDCHAWGSVPIYEFMKEVCRVEIEGSRDVLRFRPRLSLFPELDAKVPFRSRHGQGIVHVGWKREVTGVRVSIVPKTLDGNPMELVGVVITPDGYVQVTSSSDKNSLLFQLESQETILPHSDG